MNKRNLSGWVECGLPFYIDPEIEDCEDIKPYPNDLDQRVKEHFGFNHSELIKSTFNTETIEDDDPIWKEYKTQCDLVQDAIFEEMEEKEQDIDDIDDEEFHKEIVKRLEVLNNDNVNIVLKFQAQVDKIHEFIDNLPEVQAIDKENDVIWEDYQEEIAEMSFVGQGLSRPGVVVEIEKDGAFHQLLIGSINPVGGSCSHCQDIDDDTIILRYKSIWEEPKVKNVIYN